MPRAPLRRSEVLALLSEHREALRGLGVRSLALFGSVARDEAGAESDVDLLVEFVGPATCNGYMGLKFFLEDVLDSPVDLVTSPSLKAQLRPVVEHEAIRVA